MNIRFGHAIRPRFEGRKGAGNLGDVDGGNDEKNDSDNSGVYPLVVTIWRYASSGLPWCTLEIGSDRCQRFPTDGNRYAFE
jgi:hypothetical protein